jgi:hypothetical protein
MAVIGILLPLVVYGIGRGHGLSLAPSISAYYWWGEPVDNPSRDWLVGCLFALAACLYLYRGFKTAENIALNAAALLAIGVAVFPTPWNCDPCPRFTVHGTVAILLFVCLVYVVWFHARDTLDLLHDEAAAARYRKVYLIIGGVMAASPVIAFVLNSVAGAGESYVFFIEMAGIWAFGAYWIAKSIELKTSSATTKAVGGKVEVTPEGKVKEMSDNAPMPPEEALSA